MFSPFIWGISLSIPIAWHSIITISILILFAGYTQAEPMITTLWY